MKSIQEIDIQPKQGKRYWTNCHREWREEFINFLPVDRLHDNQKSKPRKGVDRQSGFGNPDSLQEDLRWDDSVHNQSHTDFYLADSAIFLSKVQQTS